MTVLAVREGARRGASRTPRTVITAPRAVAQGRSFGLRQGGDGDGDRQLGRGVHAAISRRVYVARCGLARRGRTLLRGFSAPKVMARTKAWVEL